MASRAGVATPKRLLERGGLTEGRLGSFATGTYDRPRVDAPFVPREDSENHQRHKRPAMIETINPTSALNMFLSLTMLEERWQENASFEVMPITIRAIMCGHLEVKERQVSFRFLPSRFLKPGPREPRTVEQQERACTA
jgi:hypothetical protein